MCLGIPAQILTIEEQDPNINPLLRQGTVAIGSIKQRVYLGCVPKAKVGEYVLLHAGMAIATLNEEQALQVLNTLETLPAISVD